MPSGMHFELIKADLKNLLFPSYFTLPINKSTSMFANNTERSFTDTISHLWQIVALSPSLWIWIGLVLPPLRPLEPEN